MRLGYVVEKDAPWEPFTAGPKRAEDPDSYRGYLQLVIPRIAGLPGELLQF